MRRSLKVKVTVGITGLLLLVLGATTWVSISFFNREYLKWVEARSEVLARPLTERIIDVLNSVGYNPDVFEPALAADLAGTVKENIELFHATLYDPSGKVLAHNHPEKGKGQDAPAQVRRVLEGRPQKPVTLSFEGNYHTLLPITHKNALLYLSMGSRGELIQGVRSRIATIFLLLALVSLLLCAAGVFVVIQRWVSGPIQGLASVAQAIARGDLRHTVTKRTEDEIGRMEEAFAQMIAGLGQLVLQVRTAADQVASASGQVTSASGEAAKESDATAAAIEEVSATLNEIDANIASVAKNAQGQTSSVSQTSAAIEEMVAALQHVNQGVGNLVALAQRSTETVTTGQGAVHQAIRNMEEINATLQDSATTIRALGSRAADIDRIVEVIDDLADQTNLLALNAAIEAARAGEHGLGFAVVAEEVRRLAERSAQSTKEIAQLVHGIQDATQTAVSQVERSTTLMAQGKTLSHQVGEALRAIAAAAAEVAEHAQAIGGATTEQSRGSAEIAKAASHLTGIIQEISAATEEQSAGTTQVVQAMERMRTTTQQNAARSTQLAVSSEQLANQFVLLQDAVAQFVTGNGHGTPAPLPSLSPTTGDGRLTKPQ